MSSEHEQEEEDEEQQQLVAPEITFPSLKSSPINNKCPLMSQKSCSFTNLLDAMDYSLLSSFLADTQFNPPGFESNPAPQMDQPPFFCNSHIGGGGGGGGSSFFIQKLPQLSTSVPGNMDNKLKRHLDEEMQQQQPSKKFMSSCNLTNTSNISTQTDMNQYNFLSQTFLNQQLLLSPHLQFQG